MISDKLKPCPFCGQKTILIHFRPDRRIDKFQASCTECWATLFCETKEKAIAAWNRRCNTDGNDID